ncbi:uncharacterized protein BT62DRAFT_1003259 [Guyanagaster necrorhizus]|uniref:Uncharacterized protein n=1 Tax=Guyanagaster necrorhizus TaxID=856835 RepID=A0A9P7VYG6_9AGAR|nr:uncharacterized protein BT62DRAFT_1003259 [Guyanagaster necrorhizus MCA 3950]KAG7448544.1 hypothetical protein BT62DRAFT_1003259 [Guyanagaster necrorhizus MCA 3950]
MLDILGIRPPERRKYTRPGDPVTTVNLPVKTLRVKPDNRARIYRSMSLVSLLTAKCNIDRGSTHILQLFRVRQKTRENGRQAATQPPDVRKTTAFPQQRSNIHSDISIVYPSANILHPMSHQSLRDQKSRISYKTTLWNRVRNLLYDVGHILQVYKEIQVSVSIYLSLGAYIFSTNKPNR